MKKLIIIPTPIGNLSDMSEHMKEAFSEVELLLCESMGSARRLYQHLGIPMPKWMRYWEKTEVSVLEKIQSVPQKTIGLISDAGMPCISDPGYSLVALWHELGWPLRVIPGPSAVVNAIAGSGIPGDNFQFLGFLPQGAEKRKARLEEIRRSGMTAVLYESPRRIVKLCEGVLEVFGADHPVCVAKELSKQFEAYDKGPVSEVLERLKTSVLKGEYVLVIQRAEKVSDWSKDAEILKPYLSQGDLASVLAKMHGISRSKIYQFLLKN